MNEKAEQINGILTYYGEQKDKSSQEMVVALLKELQEVNGYIDRTLQDRVIETTGVNEKLLQLIFKMYPSIKTVANRHEIVVCTGQRCQNKDAMQFLQQLKKELEIGKDGISKDGRFQLQTRNCLKHCRTSPNMLLDGELCPSICMSDAKKLLNQF